MNKEAQRIAIAKLRGWKSHVYTDATKSPGSQDTVVWSKPGCYLWELPKYDLDDMHELEKTLTDDQLDKMLLNLKNKTRSMVNGTAIMTASAAQKREAFLKTFNKWEESE
jgi:hypothetical protein